MEKENRHKIKLSSPRGWRPAVFGVLPHPVLLLNKGKRPCFMWKAEDPGQRPAGMTINFKGVGPGLRPSGAPLRSGFTLIELLVVVLIIGILAAVALPQYQKAVLKSRYATIKDLTFSIARAQEIYYLANAVYAEDFESLSIDMPAGKLDTSTNTRYNYAWGYCLLTSQKMVACTDSRAKMQLQVKYDHAFEEAGVRDCIAFSSDTNDIRNQLCRQETGGSVKIVQTDTYTGWRYQ